METFEKIKAFVRNIIVNIFKWSIVFIVSSILCINSIELVILTVVCVIDILLLLVLRNKMLKMVVNLSSYWVLGPIAQLDLMQNFNTVNVLKVVFCFLIIVITQILEYYTYKDLVVE